jgi:pyruvate, water dikinase
VKVGEWSFLLSKGVSNVWSEAKELFHRLFPSKREELAFPQIFEHFQGLLQEHQRAMELMADLGEKAGGDYIFDRQYLIDLVRELYDLLLRMVKDLNLIGSNRYADLYSTLDRIFLPIDSELRGRLNLLDAPYVISLENVPLDNLELTGGKAGKLAHIVYRTKISVPRGFVITAKAYQHFLHYNDLEPRIHGALESWAAGKETLSSTSGQIRYGMLAGIVPPDIVREIRKHASPDATRWAVRSSAYGEDGDLSFAGLHESVLNLPHEEIPEAYKRVLASLYSPEALSYRSRMGMLGEEAGMSVLCQEMIDSESSGVIQTVCVEERDSERLAIYASFGLGRTVVEGRETPDRYVVEKSIPHRIMQKTIARKGLSVRASDRGGEEEVAVDPDVQLSPAIPDDIVEVLVGWALSLERFFKQPQEIEWAVDKRGHCWLLQSRPLFFPQAAPSTGEDVCESCARYPILIQGKGAVAHTGVGAGPVRSVQSNEDMEMFPEGAVLVTRYTAPWLARIVSKASAIIAEQGSAAGHLATIAREFRVPALVGVDKATEILKDGMDITLDTHHRIVYSGRVKELLEHELLQSTVFEECPEFRLLRRLMKRIGPLHLIDPQSPDFSPEGCTSVHDMIRFIHEKAVLELMDFPSIIRRFKGAKVWTLRSAVPLGLKILDLGDGIDPEAGGDTLSIDQVQSRPLKAIWAGISHPNTWSTEPVPLDFRGLMSSLTKNWDSTAGGALAAGFNLAVVSGIYMNLHLRLGYHLNLIDARMHDDPQHNHIYFRFVGGVTDMTRRSRRAQVLAQILSQYHFNAVTRGDLIVARLLHLPKEEIAERLEVLGALIGFTRQLDIQLRSNQDISRFVQEFLGRHGHLAQLLI